MELTDIELMIQYQNGSEEAFNQLYNRHKGKVYGYILKKTGNEDMTAEIFQDVFQKLHINKMKFDRDKEFLPWFFVICHHLIIDHIRKVKTNHESLSENIVDNRETLESVTEHEEVSKLPQKEQKLLSLKFDQGYDYNEISEALGMSNAGARKVLSRALAKLKKSMGGSS